MNGNEMPSSVRVTITEHVEDGAAVFSSFTARAIHREHSELTSLVSEHLEVYLIQSGMTGNDTSLADFGFYLLTREVGE